MPDRTDTLESVEVTATRKVMLEDYEPVSAHVTETHSVPDDVDYDKWLTERQDDVMVAAEDAVMRRYEEFVREEAFGDE
jgi:hypothetical protein